MPIKQDGCASVSLHDRLVAHGALPMHMPGHKRNVAAAPHLAALSLAEDITEIDGFDNLHGACGILKESMARAAALWGAERTFYLVNGSSGGILAAIRAMTHRGDAVLLSRASHKSVYHAIELCGLRPIYLAPTDAPSCGFCGSVPPEAVEAALRAHGDVRLVILTSPTYEGVLSDVAAIADIAHAAGVPLLVDEAHGAHLSLSSAFPAGAVAAGADVVVQSLHKTLASLTQTALLHVRGGRVDAERLAHQLAVFQTSSPSYLFLSSIDGCVRTLAAEADPLASWSAALDAFDAAILPLTKLSVPFHGTRAGERVTNVFAYDRSKIFVSTAGTDMDGVALGAALRRFGIEPEMTVQNGVLAMTGIGDTVESLLALADALLCIDREAEGCALCAQPPVPPVPCAAMLPEAAMERDCVAVPLSEAVGRISSEYVWAYPPGIPLLIPGEVIDEAFVSYIRQVSAHIDVFGTRGGVPSRIFVFQ